MRRFLRTLSVLALAAFAGLAAVHAAETAAPAVVEVGLTVSDLDRTVHFFTDVLDFQLLGERQLAGAEWERLDGVFGLRARAARLGLGTEVVELTEFEAPRGRPLPVDARSYDRTFQHVAIVVSDMDAAYARLREHRVRQISTGPQRLPDWNPGAGGIEAFYFQDPDGHALEVISYPPGKGDPRWQDHSRLFLGIDHTAIVVADTDASLDFYRDALGLRIAGEGENWGPEQEHLNQVFGARLRITAVRGPSGPGIELLEYLAPPGGRPMPADVAANDLVHWQTTIVVPDVDASATHLRAAGAAGVSPGVVEVPDAVEFQRATLVRDLDGHALRLVAGSPSSGDHP